MIFPRIAWLPLLPPSVASIIAEQSRTAHAGRRRIGDTFSLYLARPDRPASTCSANLGAAARMGVQAAIRIEEILMPKSPIVYLELPSNDVAVCKQFYHSLFGWSFQDFGPDYAAFSDSGLDRRTERCKPCPRPHQIPAGRHRHQRPRSDGEENRSCGRPHHSAHLLLPRRPPLSLHRSFRKRAGRNAEGIARSPSGRLLTLK